MSYIFEKLIAIFQMITKLGDVVGSHQARIAELERKVAELEGKHV